MSNLSGPSGRSLYKICKILHTRPYNLKNISSLELDWWIENIRKDEEEEFNKFKDMFEVLKPWLNTNLFAQEQKNKKQEQETTVNTHYEEELLKHGVPISEIQKINKGTIQIDTIENEIEREINGR